MLDFFLFYALLSTITRKSVAEWKQKKQASKGREFLLPTTNRT